MKFEDELLDVFMSLNCNGVFYQVDLKHTKKFNCYLDFTTGQRYVASIQREEFVSLLKGLGKQLSAAELLEVRRVIEYYAEDFTLDQAIALMQAWALSNIARGLN